MTEQTAKKSWETPVLTIHGDVAEITQGGTKHKTIGKGDGHILVIPGVVSVPIRDYPTPS